MLRLSNPQVLMSMTRDEVINKRTIIGDENTIRLVKDYDTFSKNGAPFWKLLGHQLVTEVPGELVATTWQNFNECANVHPDKTFGDYLKELGPDLGQTMIAAATATLLTAGFGRGVARLARADEARQAAQAEQRAGLLGDLARMAEATKTRDRDRSGFAEFVQSAAEDSGEAPTEVRIDAGRLETAFAQAGITIEEVAQAMPSVGEQFAEAKALGGEVIIPIGEFMANMPGTGLEQALIPHLRTSEDGMTQEEAKKFMQARVEETLARHDFNQAWHDSAATVERELMTQLKATNRFTDDVSSQYATLASNFYRVQAARLGITPEQMYVQNPLRIVAEDVAGGQKLGQQEPVATLTGEELAPKTADTKSLRAAARAWYDENLRKGAKITNEASGRVIEFRKAGKAFSNSANPDKLRLFVALPEIIAKGTLQSSSKPSPAEKASHPNTVAYHWLTAPVVLDGKPVTVGVTIREDNEGNLYYNHNPVETKQAPQSPELGGPAGKAGVGTGEDGTLSQSIGPANDDINLVLEQAPTGTARGTFEPATNTIALLAGADLSTFVQELGHFQLKVLGDLAAQADAPAEIRADMDALLKWFNVPGSTAPERLLNWHLLTLDEQRPMHEQLARGFEAYLFEGHAPSTELQGVFSRLRAWMIHVYKSLTALDVQLTDEVRGVFDRLIATNDEILAAEAARGYTAMFQTAEEMGATQAEWQAYQAQQQAQTQEAVDQLGSRSLRDMRWVTNTRARVMRALQREADEKRKAVEAEVTAEVDAEPVRQAERYLNREGGTDPAPRAEQKAWEARRDAERERVTPEVRAEYLASPEAAGLTGIKKGQFLMRNKRAMANEVERRVLAWEKDNPRPRRPDADYSVIAEMFGFTSADHLKKAIEAAGPRDVQIQGVTDQRMLERYGDLTDADAISRAADEAIHNEARARALATELRALEKATGDDKHRTMLKAARAFAETVIGRKRIREVRPSSYSAAEARAGKAAMRAKTVVEKATEKRNQLVNNYAARAAYALRWW